MCKRIYLSLCVLALLASCQKNVVDGDDPVEWSDEPIKFSLSISGAGAGVTRAGVTRAYDNVWEDADRLGIYMVPYVADSTPADFATYLSARNKEYEADNLTSEDTKADLVEVSSAHYYPTGGVGVSFVAYYPYLSDLHSDRGNIYPVDVTVQTSSQAIDLLYSDTKGEGTSGKNDQGYTIVDNPVTMTFSHQLTKLVIKLVNDDKAYTPVDFSITDASLTISGIPTAADFDLSTAELSNPSGDGVEITPRETNKIEEGITWEAIVVPHAVAEYPDRELVFTISDRKYSILLPGDVDFEAGKVYTFQCTYIDLKVDFSDQCTITDWTDTGEQDDLAVEDTGPAVPVEVASLTDAPDGLTNSYVVAPNSVFAFPVSRAFVYESDDFTDALRVDDKNTYTGEFGVEVVWQLEKKVIYALNVDGSGKDAVVSFSTHGNEGNALVKIYKANDSDKTALWSWHIWVTSYDPTADAGWSPNSNGGNTTRDVLFMDRNLGATAAGNSLAGRGLFYQWGRKDPFPAKDVAGFSVADGGSGVTIVQAIQNPGIFYCIVSGNNNDWLASARDNSLWGGDNEANPKTIYDPCPAGWRVPFSGAGTSSPWSGFSGQVFSEGDAGGYVLGSPVQTYWPAAGCRNYTTGGLIGPGIAGFYWNATCVSTAAYALLFGTSNIGPSYTDFRTYGYPVRCVKE